MLRSKTIIPTTYATLLLCSFVSHSRSTNFYSISRNHLVVYFFIIFLFERAHQVCCIKHYIMDCSGHHNTAGKIIFLSGTKWLKPLLFFKNPKQSNIAHIMLPYCQSKQLSQLILVSSYAIITSTGSWLTIFKLATRFKVSTWNFQIRKFSQAIMQFTKARFIEKVSRNEYKRINQYGIWRGKLVRHAEREWVFWGDQSSTVPQLKRTESATSTEKVRYVWM